MLFVKLINSSMRRNRQIYSPYLTASSMLVSINYIFLAIAANNSLKHLNTGAATTALLKLGTEFILFVTIAFLIYVNRFLWQQRHQEMGLYSMLGMTKSNLQRLIIIEKGSLLAASLLIGLIIGIIFEKLAFLGLSYLLQIDHLTQPWVVPSAIWQTMLIFCGDFAILVLIDLIKVKHFTPTELWQETTDPNKHPGRMFKIGGLMGFLCLGYAYYLTVTIKPKISAISTFMLAVLFLVIGSYLVFIAGSIILLRYLQNRRHFYYQPRHFIAISGMLQRMQQNGASLATICLLCSSILVILFTSVTLYAGISSTVKSYAPRDIVMTTTQPLNHQQQSIIKKTAQHHHAEIKKPLSFQMTTPQYGYWKNRHFYSQGNIDRMTSQTTSSVIFINTKTYNKITGHHIQLNNRQALTYASTTKHQGKIKLYGQSYQAKQLRLFPSYFNPDRSIYLPTFIVVNKLPTKLPEATVASFNYKIAQSKMDHLKFEAALQNQLHLQNSNFTGQQTIKSLITSLYGGLVFIGILISLALAITTTVVIYFKQISEGYADHDRFRTMQQVGLTEHETVKSIHSQVLMVFLLPVIGALINFAFAIPAIHQIMIQLNFYNSSLMMVIGIIISVILLSFYLIIYGLTTRIYRSIVEQ